MLILSLKCCNLILSLWRINKRLSLYKNCFYFLNYNQILRLWICSVLCKSLNRLSQQTLFLVIHNTGVNNDINDGCRLLSLNSFKFLSDKDETLKVLELQGRKDVLNNESINNWQDYTVMNIIISCSLVVHIHKQWLRLFDKQWALSLVIL